MSHTDHTDDNQNSHTDHPTRAFSTAHEVAPLVPDDSPMTRREDHPDDRYQVPGAPVDMRTPERLRPHADPLVEWIRLEADDDGGEAFTLASVCGDEREMFVLADADSVVSLEAMA